jgi:catechol 2,3-dioxygenase-like lactoylglutathione lyase family enzyme
VPVSFPSRILALDHIVLVCRDIDAMLAFYRDALGCPVERSVPALGLVHLRAGTSLIDLVAAPAPQGVVVASQESRVEHFCMRIEPFDLLALRDHFASIGIDPGPVYERFGALGTGPSIYIRDPEGNTIELKGPPSPPPSPVRSDLTAE